MLFQKRRLSQFKWKEQHRNLSSHSFQLKAERLKCRQRLFLHSPAHTFSHWSDGTICCISGRVALLLRGILVPGHSLEAVQNGKLDIPQQNVPRVFLHRLCICNGWDIFSIQAAQRKVTQDLCRNVRLHNLNSAANDPSVFTITEKAPSSAFSWL